MKKLILIIGVCAVAVCAQPKKFTAAVSEACECIWFLVDGTITANTSTTGDLLSVTNSGVKRFAATELGGLIVNTDTSRNYWGSYTRNFSLLSVFDEALGEELDNQLYVATQNSSTGKEGYFYGYTWTTGSYLELHYNAQSGGFGGAFMEASDSNVKLTLSRNNTDKTTVGVSGFSSGNGPAWKLGSVIPATVQLVTDKYVQVEIGGQLVKLAVVE
jgi:hypothetical protein